MLTLLSVFQYIYKTAEGKHTHTNTHSSIHNPHTDGKHKQLLDIAKRFTMNLNGLMPVASTSQAATDVPQQRTSRSKSGDNILFKPDCIFCGSENRKRVKVQGSWTTQRLSQFEYDGGKAVLEMAESKQDKALLTRIRGQDLFACEAK